MEICGDIRESGEIRVSTCRAEEIDGQCHGWRISLFHRVLNTRFPAGGWRFSPTGILHLAMP